jgi:hypothetical protein
MSHKKNPNPPVDPNPAPVDPSTYVPMTFTATSDQPTLAEAAVALGVKLEDCDADFGVVAIDPSKRLFSVMSRSCNTTNPDGTPFTGPWSDPRIHSY